MDIDFHFLLCHYIYVSISFFSFCFSKGQKEAHSRKKGRGRDVFLRERYGGMDYLLSEF